MLPLFLGLHSIFVFHCIRVVFTKSSLCWAMLMYLNKEGAAILVPEINPSRIELYSYANNLFWFEFKSSNHPL